MTLQEAAKIIVNSTPLPLKNPREVSKACLTLRHLTTYNVSYKQAALKILAENS